MFCTLIALTTTLSASHSSKLRLPHTLIVNIFKEMNVSSQLFRGAIRDIPKLPELLNRDRGISRNLNRLNINKRDNKVI